MANAFPQAKRSWSCAGRALDLHAAWKVCLNLFDHLSAVATKTRAMVDAAPMRKTRTARC